MRAPAFWYSDRRTVLSLVLMPLGWLYGLAGRCQSLVTAGQKSGKSIICIGNFVAGGAGKTPTVIAIAGLLQNAGKSAGILTRGYGGKITGPVWVEPNQHDAADVGDEALLLVQSCSTIVAKNRLAGARELSKSDKDIILMDDGFQNPSLHKDLSLIVIDHRQGIGNGRVIPAGPLRAPVDYQISKAHGFIVIGGELVDQNLQQRLKKSGKPIFTAHLDPTHTAPDVSGKTVIAYCGIGLPDKFFATLEKAGAKIVERIRFPDHHRFSQSDAEWLLGLQGNHSQCLLVTTAKDHIRLKNTAGACAKLYEASQSFDVALKFDQEKPLLDFILSAV